MSESKESKELTEVVNDDSFFATLGAAQLQSQEERFQRNPQIKVLTDGSKPKFEIPGKKDKQELNVIVIGTTIGNEYRNPVTDPKFPDCQSVGGINGTRFGACAKCKYNVWVKDEKANKNVKACVTHDKLAVLIADEDDPTMYELRITPASRANLSEYLKDLTLNSRRGMAQVVTRMSIEKAGEGARKYGKVVFKQGDDTIDFHKEHTAYNIRNRMEEALKKLKDFFRLTPECENPEEPGVELKNAKPSAIEVSEAEASEVKQPKITEIVSVDDDTDVPF